MADEVKTKDQLLIELKAALDTGDFKAVAKVSREIDKIVVGEEKSEKDAKLEALKGITVEVRDAIAKVIGKLEDAGRFSEVCEGVWFAYEFGNPRELGINPSCKLVKVAKGAKGGSTGGGGKKFSITTNELLARHGSELMGDSGRTYQEAYDADTGGNSRYSIRMKLLKAEGLS